MEPLAHTLVGAALARTRLGRLTPLSGVTLVVAANLPDVDVITYAWGSDFALAHRRGWTHGLLAMAVLPLLLTAVVALADRWRRRRRPERPPVRPGPLLALAYLGVLTHPFLDWLNTYGVRLLMPFEDRWFFGDTLFIVDPWLWLLLGGACFLASPRRGRSLWPWGCLGLLTTLALLLGAPSPASGGAGLLPAKLLWLGVLGLLALVRARGLLPRGWWTRERLAAAGLAAAGLYVALMVASAFAARARVLAALESRMPEPVEELMVGPEPVTPFSRQVVAAGPEGYRLGRFRWFGEPQLTLGGPRIPTPVPSPVVRAALDAPTIQGLLAWVRFPFFDVEEAPEGGYKVYVLDARYTSRRTEGFGGAAVLLTPSLEPED